MLRTLLYAGDFGKLTSFFSIQYLFVFLPAVLVAFALTPKNGRKYTLLLASFGFFFLISRRLILYLLLSILSVWLFGLWLGEIHRRKNEAVKAAEKAERKAIKQKYLQYSQLVLGLAAMLHIGMILVLKYSGFFVSNVNALFGTDFAIPYFMVPIGISFFTLQAISYLFDVYRGLMEADRNPLRLALFISFFPQIVEGPICRYSQTAQQLWEVKGISWDNLTMGLQRILYGMVKKLVVADRLNAFIDCVFSDHSQYQGGIIAIAAVCYTIQLYMDFSGAMDAVCGTGQIFGITMPENFQRPFFSKTISEFWTRWHISLGGFFKDYIFYPVTMSKSMKNLTSGARKKLGNHFGSLVAVSVALFCVWLTNGLWHGAGWNYIFFGMYHFVLILTGRLIAPWAKTFHEKLSITADNRPFQIFQILRTCVLVVIGELFFRAEGLGIGLSMFGKMVTDFRFGSITHDLLQSMQISGKDFAIVGITLIFIFVVSLLNERGIRVREWLKKQPLALRWAMLYVLIFYIITFGAYGVGYIPVDPMYANF